MCKTYEKYIYIPCYTYVLILMKKKLKINKESKTLYVPKEMIDDGYEGEVEALLNARTVTIMHPDASLEEVRKSLEIVLEDVKLRIASRK